MPGTSAYPTSLDTISNLFEVANNAMSTLATAITSGDTSLTLANAASFPSSGALTIDNEIIYYTGKSTNTLTGLSRGQDGTTAAAHSSGASAEMRYTAAHHAVLNAAIRALQAKLGIGASSAAAGQYLRGNGSGASAWASIQAADLPVIAISGGGTGAITKAAAFDALSPMTGIGDLIYGGVSGTGTRLAAGTGTQVLIGGSAPVWGAVALASMVSGILPVANGGTGSATQNFVDLTNAQSNIGGNKTFTAVTQLGAGTNYNEAASASQGATAQAVKIAIGSAGTPNAVNTPVIAVQKQSTVDLSSSGSEIPFLFAVRKQSGGGNLYALHSTIRQESATLTDSVALTGNGFIDPVGYVLSAPSATPSASGGTLATGNYYYKVTAMIGGAETIASWEIAAAVTGPTGSVSLSWGAVSGATQYKVYRGTTSEAQDIRIKTTASTSYVDNGTTEGAATPPSQTNWAIWSRMERTGPVRLSGAEFGVSNTTGFDAARNPASPNATFGINLVGTGNANTSTARNNTAGLIFQAGSPNGKYYSGIYFSANTVVDQAINFQPLGSSVPATLHANNQYDTWYNTANVAKRLAALNASNIWEFDPDGMGATFGAKLTAANNFANRATLTAINSAGVDYAGLWFGSTAPTLTNYSFLYEPSLNATILNGPTAIDLRVANAGAWYINSSRHFIAQTDNSFDIGTSGTMRPRTLYLGTSLSIASGTPLVTTNQTGTGSLVMATSPTLVTPVLGVASATSLTTSGDITLTGTGRRIIADMSNGTISNRFGFQTSITDQNTVMSVIPNGTAVTSAIRAFGGSNVDNTNYGGILASSTGIVIESSKTGTGTTQPFFIRIGGTDVIIVGTNNILSLYKGADVASASTISATGNTFVITGTTTISNISLTGISPGTVLTMITQSAVTFDETGNITVQGSGSSLTTVAGDVLIAVYDGTKWRIR
jgi:hypothetical protein